MTNLLWKLPIAAVIREAFKAYGFRWKIEEYHRHIRTQYHLEDIQIKIFEGLLSILASLTVGIVYTEVNSLHQRHINQSGIKNCNKEKICELYHFVYYKTGTMLKTLLATLTPEAFLPTVNFHGNTGQLCITSIMNPKKRKMVKLFQLSF